MLSKSQIGQLLSDQVTTFCGQVQAHIEPDVFNDEAGDGNIQLDRWMDRKFKLQPHTWRD